MIGRKKISPTDCFLIVTKVCMCICMYTHTHHKQIKKRFNLNLNFSYIALTLFQVFTSHKRLNTRIVFWIHSLSQWKRTFRQLKCQRILRNGIKSILPKRETFCLASPRQRLICLKHLFCKTSNSIVMAFNKTTPLRPITHKHLENALGFMKYSQVSMACHSSMH